MAKAQNLTEQSCILTDNDNLCANVLTLNYGMLQADWSVSNGGDITGEEVDDKMSGFGQAYNGTVLGVWYMSG